MVSWRHRLPYPVLRRLFCTTIRGCCVWQQIKLGRACAAPRMAIHHNKQLSKPGEATFYVVLVYRLVNSWKFVCLAHYTGMIWQVCRKKYVILTVQHLLDMARNFHYQVTMYQTRTAWAEPSGMTKCQTGLWLTMVVFTITLSTPLGCIQLSPFNLTRV